MRILDLDYRAEMNRRLVLRTGEPLRPPNTARNVPQPFFNDWRARAAMQPNAGPMSVFDPKRTFVEPSRSN
jgi:hypothetical protein